MPTRPPVLTLKECVSFHLFYLFPVLLRGALISRPFGSWLVQFCPDPIGRRFFGRLVEKYGSSVFETWAANPPFGFDRTYIVLDFELIKQVLDTDSADYEVADLNRKIIGRFAPGSMIISDACEHDKLRQYSVAPERLATGREISTHSQAIRLLETVKAEVGYTLGSSRAYFTWLEFSSLAERLTVRIVLGPSGCRDNAGVEDMRLVRLLKKLIYSATGFFGRRSRQFNLYYCMLRQRAAENAGSSLIGKLDLEHASEAQATFWMMALSGGLDTVLPRTLALILSHQSVYDEVIEELVGVDLMNPGETDQQLLILEGCVLETIRLWTDTPLINRKRLTDGKIGQYEICAAKQILIPAAYVHRDPDVFRVNTNTFDPHRWLKTPRPEGLQFSLGLRSCGGRDVALFVIKASLAHIIRHRTLSLKNSKLTSCKNIPDMFDHFHMRIWRD